MPRLTEWISKLSAADKKLKKIYSGSRSASCSPKKQSKPTDLSGLSRIQLQQVLLKHKQRKVFFSTMEVFLAIKRAVKVNPNAEQI